MAELLIRAGLQDVAFVERVMSGPRDRRPDRLVVDAHVAVKDSRISEAALTAGVPFMIDPQTHFWQDVQHPHDAWANLPFGRPGAMTPSDFLRPGVASALASAAIRFQLDHGARALLLPYVHIERTNTGWVEAQRALWRASDAYLRENRLRLPIIGVLALGWRLLDRSSWSTGLRPLLAALEPIGITEVALAASKVDQGAHPEERIASMLATIRRASKKAPVIAWQQGVLGEVAVAAGAIGYECGLGWRDRCDLGMSMTRRRRPQAGFGPRPVFVPPLGRSLAPQRLRAVLGSPTIAASLTCLDVTCCPAGKAALLQDGRGHGLRSRLRDLRSVSAPARAAWRWNQVAIDARDRLATLQAINVYTQRADLGFSLSTDVQKAVILTADSRRQAEGKRSAA